MTLRVLYVVHSIPEYDKTGTPYAVWRLASMAKQRFGVEVAFLIGSPYDKLLRAKFDSIPVYMLPPIDMHENFFEDLRADRREYLGWVDAVIREFQPTILHVYNFVGLSYQILRLKTRYPQLKIVRTITHTEDVCYNVDPVVPTETGAFSCCPGPFPVENCVEHFRNDYGDQRANLRQQFQEHYHQLNTYYKNYVDGVIFSGRGFHDFMAKIFALPKKRWLIPYGIPPAPESDGERRQRAATDPLLVGFFGGLGPRKGLRLVLQAIRKRPDIMNHIHLQVIGVIVENRLHAELMSMKAQFPAQIEILGRLADEQMDAAMRDIDVAVLPTLFESYNITLRELLLRGTPVIVTDTYGSEKICDGINGFVFPRNDEDALLAILDRLIGERDLLTHLQTGAKKTPIETLEDECAKIVGVYRSLLTEEVAVQ